MSSRVSRRRRSRSPPERTTGRGESVMPSSWHNVAVPATIALAAVQSDAPCGRGRHLVPPDDGQRDPPRENLPLSGKAGGAPIDRAPLSDLRQVDRRNDAGRPAMSSFIGRHPRVLMEVVQMNQSPNPILSGFHPDPSIVQADGAYFLVTSTFEYLPGLPIYRSTDLVRWTQIGNVVTRPDQVELESVPTPGGLWAPTIRYRDGVFYVIVTVMLGGRGCVVFTTTDPSGPGATASCPAVDGIDPDLAWDDDGTAIISFRPIPRCASTGARRPSYRCRAREAAGTMDRERSVCPGKDHTVSARRHLVPVGRRRRHRPRPCRHRRTQLLPRRSLGRAARAIRC